MTPTDLETLRGLVQILREYEGRIACGNAAWDADDWSNYNKFQYEADHLLNSFTRKASKSIPSLTALLADYERMREGLDNAVQQLSELAQPLTPALNGSYAKGEQVGYENAVRIISALRATLKGEKHE